MTARSLHDAVTEAQANSGNEMLRAALDYAKSNLKLIPVGGPFFPPGSGPFGEAEASSEPDMIRKWFEEPGYNIGIDCRKSGIVVLHVECLSSFKRYLADHALAFPTTYQVVAPSGETQFYLKAAGTCAYPHKIFDGVWVQKNNHVVAPPSYGYTRKMPREIGQLCVVDSAPVAVAPSWLASPPPPVFRFEELDLKRVRALHRLEEIDGVESYFTFWGEYPPVVYAPDDRSVEARTAFLMRGLVTADTVAPRLTQNYLIKNVLLCSTVALIYGQSGVGKSFFGLQIAHSIASGIKFNGHAVTQGKVLYLALEGKDGFVNRICALGEMRHPNLVVRTPEGAGINLYQDDADALAISATANQLGADGIKVKLIVIDPCAQAMTGADENMAVDMNKFIANITAIKNATGAAVLLVHHSGKNIENGARGSSVLRAAVDSEFEMRRREDGAIEVRATKQRDLDVNWKLAFQLAPVELNNGHAGETVSTPRVEFLAESVGSVRLGSERQRQVLEQLHDYVAEMRGALAGGESDDALSTRVAYGDFVERAASTLLGKTPSEAHRSIKESLKGLIKRGIVCHEKDQLWLVVDAGS